MMYVGTYTGKTSEGIYKYDYDGESGILSQGRLAAEITNPSYLIASRDGHWVFSVSETGEFQGTVGGAVFMLERNICDGSLMVRASEKTYGKDPCHLCFDQDNGDVYTANYSEGSISRIHVCESAEKMEYELQFKDQVYHEGRGVRADRQEKSHVHFVAIDQVTRYLWTVDLGIDSLALYDLNNLKKRSDRDTLLKNPVAQFKLPDGFGPRHMVFHPNMELVYCVQELVSKVVVIQLENGIPQEIIQEVSLSEENNLFSAAAVKMNRLGNVIYVTNRGADTITAFSIKEEGRLQLIGTYDSGGKNPRDIELSPEERFLYCANQDSDLVTVFSVMEDGGLSRRQDLDQSISMPVCICFV